MRITNSLLVSTRFNKKHTALFKIIEDIIKNNHLEIKEVKMYIEKKEYRDFKGDLQTIYEMDEKFFTLLVMNLNGKEAMDFKIDYINSKETNFDYTNWIKYTN